MYVHIGHFFPQKSSKLTDSVQKCPIFLRANDSCPVRYFLADMLHRMSTAPDNPPTLLASTVSCCAYKGCYSIGSRQVYAFKRRQVFGGTPDYSPDNGYPDP